MDRLVQSSLRVHCHGGTRLAESRCQYMLQTSVRRDGLSTEPEKVEEGVSLNELRLHFSDIYSQISVIMDEVDRHHADVKDSARW